MAANRIYIQVDFQQQGAVGAVNQLNQAVASIGPTTQQASRQASQGVSGLSLTIKQAQQSFSGMGSALAGLGLAAASKQILETTADLDSLRKQLEVVEKSTGAAQVRFAQLQEMAKKPGLALEPAIKGYVDLMSTMQLSTKEATDMLAAFGKALAQVGGGGPELDAVILQVTQMLSSGKVLMADLRPVLQRLPQMRSTMAEIFKGATSPEEIDKLGVSSKEFLSKITEAFSKLKDVTPGLKEDLDDIAVEWRLLAEEAGKAIAPVLIPMLKQFQSAVGDLLKEFKQLPPEVQNFAVKATVIATGVGSIATAIGLVTIAVKALGASLLANPYVLALLGLGAAATYGYEKAKENPRIAPEFQKYAAGTGLVGDIGRGLQWLSPSMSTDMANLRAGGTAPVPLSPLSGLTTPPPPRKLTDEQKRAALDLKQHTASVQRASADALRDAAADRSKMFGEFAKGEDKLAQDIEAMRLELQRRNEKSLTWVDAKGNEQRLKASAETLSNWDKEFQLRRQTLEDKYRLERQQKEAEAAKETMDTWFEAYDAMNQYRREASSKTFEDTEQLQIQAIRQGIQLENDLRREAIDYRHDRELQALEGAEARTLQQQLAVNQKRLGIEIDYVNAVLAEDQRLLQFERERAIEAARVNAIKTAPFEKLGTVLQSPEMQMAEDAINQLYDQRSKGLDTRADQRRDIERLKAVTDQARIVRGEMQKTFDYFQRLGEGVFDAMLSKSKSVWQSMADFFKLTVLTMLKSIFTSIIANTMMRLFFGGGGSAAGARSQVRTGGGLASIFGSVFGGGGGGNSPLGGMGPGGIMYGGSGDRNAGGGGFGLGGWLQRLVGGPGGTGGFAGPVSYATASSGTGGVSLADLAIWDAAQKTQGAGIPTGGRGGLAGILGNLKGGFKSDTMNGLLAMAGLGMAVSGFNQKGAMGVVNRAGGGAMAAYGIAGKQLGLMGSAGVGLAYNGLVQGGWKGLAQTTAGGALIGAQFGGPIGALIGAGIGAAAGGIRMLFKGAAEKTKQRIKEIYGVDIQSQGVITQIVDIAKSQYGGDMNLALYSPQVRELIQLYAMTQGTTASNMGRPMLPVSWAMSGGSATVQPVYSGGNVVSNPYVGPTTAQTIPSIYTQLNPAQANQLFEGRVVQVIGDNAPAVADASTSAMDPTYRRTSQQGSLVEPLTVLS